MAFLSEPLIEAVKFIFLVGVAVAGVFTGKALRKRKDSQNKTEEMKPGE